MINQLKVNKSILKRCPPFQVEQVPLAEQGGTVVHRFSEPHHGKHLITLVSIRKLLVLVDSADHEGEDEGGGGGLDDPEGDQGGRLDSSEQVHLEIAKHVKGGIAI